MYWSLELPKAWMWIVQSQHPEYQREPRASSPQKHSLFAVPGTNEVWSLVWLCLNLSGFGEQKYPLFSFYAIFRHTVFQVCLESPASTS